MGAGSNDESATKMKSSRNGRPKLSNKVYEAELFRLQTEFVKLQE
ncbi:hypothetical protein M2272_000342 [Mycobacterium frederiksbergense]|uniref:Uncharacterized protein n=1 Tax=Mycolicibacterium frederiksbergense TaxID=117567 RepID=A0ABT6KSM0_9MYCO|nr:hypothetical protein [Mycolicibacterium frederiksbergense]